MVKIACYFVVVRGMGLGPHFLEGPSQTFERGPENLRVLFSKFEGWSKARAWNL